LTHFEYVTVFLSIVMALAVAELLAGLGRLIRERQRVRVYWVHVAWMIMAIMAVTQSWWVVWASRTHDFSNFLEYFSLILPRFLFVLCAFLLSPPIAPGESLDLREYYFRHFRWVAFLFATSLSVVALSRSALGIEPLLTWLNAIRAIIIGMFVLLGFVKNPRVHEVAAVLVGGLFLIAIGLTSLRGS